MTETLVEIIGIGLLLLVVVVGIVKMKSPTRGADSLGVVIEEIQKAMEPQVKQIREAKGKKNMDQKQKKNGEDGKPAA
jgi:hypothetical protein